MWWLPFTAMILNLFIIWRMPKSMTRKEIYVTWLAITALNLSTDIILSLYLKLYELGRTGIQLRVHLLEWTLSPTYGVIFINFMPSRQFQFVLYLLSWIAYSVVFEALTVHVHFLNYKGWKLWYSALYYLFIFLFLRWHIHFLRSSEKK